MKTAEELEREANMLLYGSQKEPVRRGAFQYARPKNVMGENCQKCGLPRGKLSGRYCRACYLRIARENRTKNEKPIMPNLEYGYEGEAGNRVPVVKE